MSAITMFLSGSPLGNGEVRLSWTYGASPTVDLYDNGQTTGRIPIASTIAILAGQTLGKHVYQLKDEATGGVSTKATVTVT
jgi:hypothetical protein